MDDTSWITYNNTNLEEILEIVDDFNLFNNICINKYKSLLLTNNLDVNKLNSYQLKFDSIYIKIKPILVAKSVRILGIWININMKKAYVI